MSTSPNLSTPLAIPLVDLVIAIDSSSSMRDEAVGLSEIAEVAIEATKTTCPSDLRVTWLGVEGRWNNTQFDRTIRDYLTRECQVDEAELLGRKRGTVAGGGAQEDGARAIEDLATHFNWRPGTTRAIFYLSDEGLEGGGSEVNQEDIEAANRAIETAKSAHTTVCTYFGTSRSSHKEELQQEFARVAHETGGEAFTAEDSTDGFTQILEKIICTTRNKAADEMATATVTLESATPEMAASETVTPEVVTSETATPEMATSESATGTLTHRIVLNHSLVAAGIGLIPLPLLDIAAVGVTQLVMIRKLSQFYEVPFIKHRATAFIAALIGAGELGLIMTSVGQLVPGIGATGFAVTTAASAGVLTYAIGKVFVRHFELGGTFLNLDANVMRDYFAEQCQEGKLVISRAKEVS